MQRPDTTRSVIMWTTFTAVLVVPAMAAAQASREIKLDLALAAPGASAKIHINPGTPVEVHFRHLAPGVRFGNGYTITVTRAAIAPPQPVASPPVPGAAAAGPAANPCDPIKAAINTLESEQREAAVMADSLAIEGAFAAQAACAETATLRSRFNALLGTLNVVQDLGTIDRGEQITIVISRNPQGAASPSWTIILDGGPPNTWLVTFGWMTIGDYLVPQANTFVQLSADGKTASVAESKRRAFIGAPVVTFAFADHDHDGLGFTPTLTFNAGYSAESSPVAGVGFGLLYRDFLMTSMGVSYHSLSQSKPQFQVSTSVPVTTTDDALREMRGSVNPFVSMTVHIATSLFGGSTTSGK